MTNGNGLDEFAERTDDRKHDEWRRVLYWLAGARWDTLRVVDASERERIATIGSAVLIPSLAAFIGMTFFLWNRYDDAWRVLVVLGALVWAIIILNVDRILVSTYRPLAPFYRKAPQVVLRFMLATVVSMAIGFPFCLDLYRPAIDHHYRARLSGIQSALQKNKNTAVRTIEKQFIKDEREIDRELNDLERRNPRDVTPEAQVDRDVNETRSNIGNRAIAASELTALAISDAATATAAVSRAEKNFQAARTQRESREESLAAEARGDSNAETKVTKKGFGERWRAIRDLVAADRRHETEMAAALEASRGRLRQAEERVLAGEQQDRDDWVRRIEADRPAAIAAVIAQRQAAAEKDTEVRERYAALKEARTTSLAEVEAEHGPRIEVYARKLRGDLDPLEETIGLYRVIFESNGDDPGALPNDDRLRPIAGLLQFGVVFLVLFFVDLIPIVAKVFSPPGSYDAIVATREEIARANLAALQRSYPETARAWMRSRFSSSPARPTDIDSGIALSDSDSVARLLLTIHEHPRDPQAAFDDSYETWAHEDAPPARDDVDDERTQSERTDETPQ